MDIYEAPANGDGNGINAGFVMHHHEVSLFMDSIFGKNVVVILAKIATLSVFLFVIDE